MMFAKLNNSTFLDSYDFGVAKIDVDTRLSHPF